MTGDEVAGAGEGKPILGSLTFRHRLDEEVARVRRSGGFLSLALIEVIPSPGSLPGVPVSLARVLERLRNTVRMEDVLAERTSRVALLMPGTSLSQAARAAARLLGIVNARGPADPPLPMASAGLASTYGEVEGGGAALLAAAEEALKGAAPGQFARSLTLQGRPRVLVVDDDMTFAQTLAEAISEREWDAHPCTDVSDALDRAGDPSYSGFFIDVVLPKVSGVDILRKAMLMLPRRPAVLMSGQDVDPSVIVDTLALGPVMFIRKPLTLADLDAALDMFRHLLPGVGSRRRPRP